MKTNVICIAYLPEIFVKSFELEESEVDSFVNHYISGFKDQEINIDFICTPLNTETYFKLKFYA